MTSNNRVLVTGADGFIGSHLTEALVKKGYQVKAFVHYNSFNSWGWLDHSTTEIKQKIDIFSGDIRDPHGVKEAMFGCDYVLHLAALIAIPFSYHSPDSYVDTNIKGTLNILQAARELGIKKLIHTSTSEVYGTAKYVPIDENHPLQGQSPYSASKIGSDQLVNSFFTSFELPVMTLRPFNTYGPRQSARAIIPTIITQLLEGKEKIELGSLEPTRDFSYISDTVNAFLSAIESNSGLGEVINVGSGFEISIGKVAQLISDQMGLKLEILSSKNRIRPEKSEVERLWADNSKAKDLLSWSPSYGQIDGFAKGIQETIAWFSIPSNLSQYKSNLYNI
jgi:dTDP-glucose 4,6-dehydratase